MAILKVARMGHPVLRMRARALDAAELTTPPIQRLIDDMIETMKEYQGIGLAAPQVHESLRLFVAGSTDEEHGFPLTVVANPDITVIGSEIGEDWEGCLSIPEVRGRVPRARQIYVRGLDRQARKIELKLSGFPARVMQHETDHLDGVLFLDRMTSFETLTFLDEFGRYWSREEVPPE
ncbi:MAG TPA: peptide deformylase [Vicinamibacterales bacterium]|jgi:peptide deformylase|nr:peptide deformylase [Vicinamibacterales bacterium]